ncbi:hypothetical protein [Mesorhizobium sp. M8A.F.Ca.ET.165.01.1.1]|uniref:hypothetical protein n=1 Tax=Mesorhizobium sp. M8A.F.Ca.ET.165.01.1.1 TaxID=2563960 RepID=UPI00167209F7|nr:hypothetical protein [Mesorhizobium sp. M8A.F.Ca.ET.165.01.1.1]
MPVKDYRLSKEADNALLERLEQEATQGWDEELEREIERQLTGNTFLNPRRRSTDYSRD